MAQRKGGIWLTEWPQFGNVEQAKTVSLLEFSKPLASRPNHRSSIHHAIVLDRIVHIYVKGLTMAVHTQLNILQTLDSA